MSEKPVHTSQLQNPSKLNQRIADLQARKPKYINHGEALLLQRTAADSLREQFLTGDRRWIDD
ncbi:hypothetical protein [Ruegeria profundi]|uniref:Uncharacterized protein n=1 Tax=Ruegeria profundi TaxID=1685378 RepID=A0A0X3U542_9RHOB|nr:hypothetical protein [Ruegeria profundi]KUJ81886.1 hypothetical protein AVO44_00930 [Ruegeria profundi]